MLQWIIKKVDPKNTDAFLEEMNKKYPKKQIKLIQAARSDNGFNKK